MSFSTIYLVSSYIGKLIDTHSNIARVALLSLSFDPTLLEGIFHKLLRYEWTPTIFRYMATFMSRNLSVKTKESLRTDMQHTLGNASKDWAIFTGRLEDWLLELWKRYPKLFKGWLNTIISQCAIQAGMLFSKISQCAIFAGKWCRPKDCIAQFSRPTDTTSQNSANQH